MNLVPGMELKSADHTGVVVSVKPNCFHIDIPEYGDIQRITKEYYTQWQPTGEVDWSLVPDGTDVEAKLMGCEEYIIAKKIGSKDKQVLVEYRNEKQWVYCRTVRIPQPEPYANPMPEPVIDFENDPPKPGDEYIRRDGRTTKFIGMGFIGSARWVFENSVGFFGHYNSDGRYVKNCPDSTDIIARKPAKPIKRKEKFWVNIYGKVGAKNFESREQADIHKDYYRRACKEIEIEWEEGEGL